MDFKQLEVFVAVVKHKSFSKAARELFLTQPTVSAHIQNLENELETVLLNRNNKTISLTESGKILYDNAIIIMNNCKKAVYSIKEYSGKIEGLIDIVCSSIPEAYILPEFLHDFTAQYPDVKFSISHADSHLAISEILNETINFGLVGSKISNSQIKYINLVNDELVLITPKETVLESIDGAVNSSVLTQHKWIMRKEGSGTRDIIVKGLSMEGISLNDLDIVAHVESNEAIKEMVKQGTGISLVSRMSIADEIANSSLNVYTIKGVDLSRKFYFIYSKKKTFTPLENKFLESILEHFGNSK